MFEAPEGEEEVEEGNMSVKVEKRTLENAVEDDSNKEPEMKKAKKAKKAKKNIKKEKKVKVEKE